MKSYYLFVVLSLMYPLAFANARCPVDGRLIAANCEVYTLADLYFAPPPKLNIYECHDAIVALTGDGTESFRIEGIAKTYDLRRQTTTIKQKNMGFQGVLRSLLIHHSTGILSYSVHSIGAVVNWRIVRAEKCDHFDPVPLPTSVHQ